ncbi:MAG: hypothetical protein ACOH5I_12825 [Oligoflexus sp.]
MLQKFWKNYGPLSLGLALVIALLLPALVSSQQDLKLILILFGIALASILAGHVLAQMLFPEKPEIQEADQDAVSTTEEFTLQPLDQDLDGGEKLSQILLAEIHQEGLFYEKKTAKKSESTYKSAS